VLTLMYAATVIESERHGRHDEKPHGNPWGWQRFQW
jgi:hypothetical protein